MMLKFIRFSPLVIGIAFICVLVYKLQAIESLELSIAPEYTKISKVPDALNDGKMVNIRHDDKPTVLHVFSTWCQCCREEIPEIIEITKETPMIGLVLGSSHDTIKAWFNQNNNPYTSIGLLSHADAVELGISRAPVTVVVSPNGHVLSFVPGQLTKQKFKTKVLPFLQQHRG